MMIDITLEDFASDDGEAPGILRELYVKVLKGNPKWHYFWEGRYTSLRIPEVLKRDVLEFLEAAEVAFKIEGEYIDNIKVTAKYQEHFERLFNVYSSLSFEMEEEDFFHVLDRVCHCFLNNSRTVAADADPNYEEWAGRMCHDIWEAMCLAKVGAERSLIVGWMRGQVQERKRISGEIEKLANDEEGLDEP
jgi:hypothetical protein